MMCRGRSDPIYSVGALTLYVDKLSVTSCCHSASPVGMNSGQPPEGSMEEYSGVPAENVGRACFQAQGETRSLTLGPSVRSGMESSVDQAQVLVGHSFQEGRFWPFPAPPRGVPRIWGTPGKRGRARGENASPACLAPADVGAALQGTPPVPYQATTHCPTLDGKLINYQVLRMSRSGTLEALADDVGVECGSGRSTAGQKGTEGRGEAQGERSPADVVAWGRIPFALAPSLP